MSCHPTMKNNNQSDNHKSKRAQHYIELCLNLQDAVKRPLVACSNEEMAQRASHHVSHLKMKIFRHISMAINCICSFFFFIQINYAKSVYDERELTLNYETVIDI